MTQSPNEILARMMRAEKIYHERSDGILIGKWPDFANDANHAERLAAWLAEREDIAYFYYCWRLKRAVLVINRGTKIFNGAFCEAITAAGLWYNETKGGNHE